MLLVVVGSSKRSRSAEDDDSEQPKRPCYGKISSESCDIVFLCSFPFILVKGSFFFSVLYYQIGE